MSGMSGNIRSKSKSFESSMSSWESECTPLDDCLCNAELLVYESHMSFWDSTFGSGIGIGLTLGSGPFTIAQEAGLVGAGQVAAGAGAGVGLAVGITGRND